MGLQETIQGALKGSIKNRDTARTAAIRVVIGEFQRQPDKQLADEQVVAIIRKLIKSERELLAVSGRDSSEFVEILEDYLPAMATEAEISAWIGAHIDFSSLNSRMQAMKPIMAHFGSRADGNLVKEILQRGDWT